MGKVFEKLMHPGRSSSSSRVCPSEEKRIHDASSLHEVNAPLSLFLPCPFFFLFYRDSTLLTPQAQSARRDSSSVVRIATLVTILWGIRYDRAYPLAMQHIGTYTNAHPHVRGDSRYRECDTCRRRNKVPRTFWRSHERCAIERVNLYHVERMLVRISERPWEMPITGWSEGNLRAGMLRITRRLDYRKYVSFQVS